MVFIFIQALQLQKVLQNLKDIGAGFQVCVTDADAITTPMFWIGIKILIS